MRTSKKNRFFILYATILGGIVEWYEIFLFIFWNELFSKLFFNNNTKLAIYNILFIFFFGFLGRPIGAVFFGDIGDRFGRRLAFISSIALMVLPSILIGLMGLWILPSSGYAVAITLCLLRFIQGMSAGAELPGAMCYLIEIAPPNKRAFYSSFSFLGPQIGILLSQLESYFFETHFSKHFVENYGWRISFIIGGIIGFIALFSRQYLQESPVFKTLKEKKLVSHKPVVESFEHGPKIFLGFFGSLLAVIGFYMLSIFIDVYFSSVFSIRKTNILLISICVMGFSTATLTLFGRLGDRFPIRKLLTLSAIGIALFSLPLYFWTSIYFVLFIIAFLMILLNIQFAILPSYIAELFPSSIRYTGIALSFGFCDSVIGGATPWIAGMLTKKAGVVPTFTTFIFIASLISLGIFLITKKNELKITNT